MSKDPTPRADALREQREARYGHLQATAPSADELALLATKSATKVPYAGKPLGGQGGEKNYGNNGHGGGVRPKKPREKPEPVAYAGKGNTTHETLCGAKNAAGPHKPPRKRVKRKRRTELPPEKETT